MKWINEILAQEITTIQVNFKNENFDGDPNNIIETQLPKFKIKSENIQIISEQNDLPQGSTKEHVSTHKLSDANGFAVIDYNNQYYVLTTSNFMFENSENNNKQLWNSTAYSLKNIKELQNFLKNSELFFYEPQNSNINKTIKECLDYDHIKNTEPAPKKTKHNKM